MRWTLGLALVIGFVLITISEKCLALPDETPAPGLHRVGGFPDPYGKLFAASIFCRGDGKYHVLRDLPDRKVCTFDQAELDKFLAAMTNKSSLVLNNFTRSKFDFASVASEYGEAALAYKKIGFERVALSINRFPYNGVGKPLIYVYDTKNLSSDGAADLYQRLPPVYEWSKYPDDIRSTPFDLKLVWDAPTSDTFSLHDGESLRKFDYANLGDSLKDFPRKSSVFIRGEAEPWPNFSSSFIFRADKIASLLMASGFERVVILVKVPSKDQTSLYYLYDTAASDDVIKSKEKVRVY